MLMFKVVFAQAMAHMYSMEKRENLFTKIPLFSGTLYVKISLSESFFFFYFLRGMDTISRQAILSKQFLPHFWKGIYY